MLVKNRFDVFDEDASGDVVRPLPVQRVEKADKTKKRKPTEKFIRADYSYDYEFDESPTQTRGTKSHKKQERVKRADLAGLLDTLNVSDLEEVLARQPEDAKPAARFVALIEAVEQHLLHARDQSAASNAEKWASFNTPYGETKDEVLGFLTDFIRNEMSFEEQVVAARYIVKRLLKNVNSATNASAGFGIKLGAQVLFRESAWALVAVIPDIKESLPKIMHSSSSGGNISVKGKSSSSSPQTSNKKDQNEASAGNVTSVPSAYIPTVVFIGAQLLANEEDPDARYAALSYGLEVLGYAGLHNKESLAVEYLARAYARYQSKHGNDVDPAYARLSTSVAERALHDLHKIQVSFAKDPASGSNKNSPFHSILPYVSDLNELVLYMGLLSASPSRALGLFGKASSHSSSASKVLTRLTPDRISQYDTMTKKTITQLAKDLVDDLSRHYAAANKGSKSKQGPALVTFTDSVEAKTVQFADAHKVDSSKLSAASGGDSSSPKSGARRHNNHASYGNGRHRKSGGCCSFLFKIFITIAVIYVGIHIWQHHMTEPRRVIGQLLKPYQHHIDAVQPHVDSAVKIGNDALQAATDFHKANIQPHIDTHIQPHIDTATQYVQPHIDTATEFVRPHYETAVKAAEPHWETAKVQAASLSEKAVAFFHAQIVPLFWQLVEIIRANLALLGKKLDEMGNPWTQHIQPFYAKNVAPIWPNHVLPAYNQYAAPHYNAHVAPHVKTVCDAVSPHYNTAVAAIHPYWQLLHVKLDEFGHWLDDRLHLD